MKLVNLNPVEERVLALLALGNDQDFGFRSFAVIARRTRLNRSMVRRACRSLARKGLAVFARGLWSEDGTPAGSGYCSTPAGRDRADPKLVKRYEAREYCY